MPLPRKTFTQEQIEAGKQLIRQALELGAMEMHETFRLRDEPRENMIVDLAKGVVVDRNYQPTTVAAWVADCKERGVVPVTANLGRG